MSNPERPKHIEKQRELYKLPRKEINWAELPSGFGEIETSLDRALRKILTPPNFERLSDDEQEKIERKVSLQIAAIEAKAVRAGFDTSFAKRGDKVTLDGGVLYLDLKREKKAYAVKLDKSATVLSEYQEIKPEAVVKSRRAWESLKEAMGRGVVSEILMALAGGDRRAGAFENRKRIWKEVLGQSEAFRGTAEQNRSIVQYVKSELAAGRTPDIAPKPAPAEKKTARERREEKEKKGRWPARDAYMEYIRQHPLPPEAPNSQKEAVHKVEILLGPRLDEIDQAIEDALKYDAIARRNMRGGLTGVRDAAQINRGSAVEAMRAVDKAKDAIGKLRRASQDLMDTLTKVENDIREKGSHPQQTASIERSKTALRETMGELDNQYQTATNRVMEWTRFLETTRIRPTNE